MDHVTWAACSAYELQLCLHALTQVLEPIGGLDWVRPGMKVGIKANLVHAAPPEAAATTHPVLLQALTQLLRRRGAEVIVGDSPGGLYTAAALERVYRQCGLTQVEGAALNRDFSTADGTFAEGKVLRQFRYTAWLDGCDGIINFSKLKTHGMMGMTGAVKNLFGVIPGTMKPEYHYRFPDPMDFAHMLVDLQQWRKPQLHLMDAVVTMEGNGPTAGTPRPLGLVLAAKDPYYLDQVCAELLGLGDDRVLTQAAARQRGLIPNPVRVAEGLEAFRPASFEISPVKSTLFRNLLPGKAGEALGNVIGRVLEPRPALTDSLCIGCEKCAGICPAKAITMVRKKPKIDHSRCIRCFCCQEFCPKGALRAKRTALARLLTD